MHKEIAKQGFSLDQIRSTISSSQLHKQWFKVSKFSNEIFPVSWSQDVYGHGGRLSLRLGELLFGPGELNEGRLGLRGDKFLPKMS